MAFVSLFREIGRNGVLNLDTWPRHRVLNPIELNRYIVKSIAINQIEKRDINYIPIDSCALRACYSVSNRIESNKKICQLIESIKFHTNNISNGKAH